MQHYFRDRLGWISCLLYACSNDGDAAYIVNWSATDRPRDSWLWRLNSARNWVNFNDDSIMNCNYTADVDWRRYWFQKLFLRKEYRHRNLSKHIILDRKFALQTIICHRCNRLVIKKIAMPVCVFAQCFLHKYLNSGARPTF